MLDLLILHGFIAMFEGYVFLSYFHRRYGTRTGIHGLLGLVAAYAALMVAFQSCSTTPIATMAVAFSLNLGMTAFFRASHRERILNGFALFFTGLVCEVGCEFAYNRVLTMFEMRVATIGIFTVVPAFASKLLYLLIMRVVLRYQSRRSSAIPFKWFLAMITIPITGIAALVVVALNQQRFDPLAISIILLALFVANIGVFWMCDASIRLLSTLLQASREKAVLKGQLQCAQSDAEHAETAYQQLHDTDIHFETAYRLIESQHFEDARDYLAMQRGELKAFFDDLSIARIPAVDMLLRQKQQRAESRGIEMHQQVSLFEGVGIRIVPLCTFLGNALNNAIEACEHVDGARSISVNIVQLPYALLVNVRNTSQPVEIADDLCPTTKAEPTEHGYGLKSMRRIVEQNDGTFSLYYGDGMFEMRATFYTNKTINVIRPLKTTSYPERVKSLSTGGI